MCGDAWDIPLNETGISQAHQAGMRLKANTGMIHTVYSSPLQRAHKTAEIISSHYNLSPSLVDELREWNIGSWDRLPFEQVKSAFLGDDDPENGETRRQFQARINGAIEKMRHARHPLVIVSHGAVWLVLQKILEMQPLLVENGIPYLVSRFDNKWQAAAV